MTAPRLEVRLDRIRQNAEFLVQRLAPLGISVTGVTKATLGSPEVAHELISAGVVAIGESRIESIEALRKAGLTGPMTLIRSPMLSQVDRVVRSADTSLNTEVAVVEALSRAAARHGVVHGVLLMVELGDLREGILAVDLEQAVRCTLSLPNVVLRGIGTNLACQSGVRPDQRKMCELSTLADSVEAELGVTLAVVSGGNSANLDWALGVPEVGRINDLRLGEAILLGCEPLRRRPIEGLRTDAFTLVGEVIEVKDKPMRSWGVIDQTAFGTAEPPAEDGEGSRVIVAIGRQDADPDGLVAPLGWEILGASSDHLVLRTETPTPVGSEVRFGLGYGALLRAMTSPFVARCFLAGP